MPLAAPAEAGLFADKSLSGETLSREEARAVLDWPEEGLLDLVASAYKVRRAHFGKRVKLNYLVNLQSGLCAEDCSYCSQSKISKAGVEKYKILSAEEVMGLAERAVAGGAARLCLVASMRGPGERDIAAVEATVRQVKGRFPQLEICTSLGLLQAGQADRLAAAGVDAYNHNLNTSENHYEKICHTHTYNDRLDTVGKAKTGGLSPCSGALFGMGENKADMIDVAFRLREISVDSIPINFLIPVPGTPLAGKEDLTPTQCLKILCLFRFLNPAAELRIAGGRELHLRSLQAMGLFVANSIFVGDYLTTQGQAAADDKKMVRDMGFEIEGETTPSPAPSISENVRIVTKGVTAIGPPHPNPLPQAGEGDKNSSLARGNGEGDQSSSLARGAGEGGPKGRVRATGPL